MRPHQILGVLFLGRMMMEVIVNPFTLRRANLHVTSAQDAEVMASAEACERSLIAARQMLVRLKDQIETIKGGATLIGSADFPQQHQKGRAR